MNYIEIDKEQQINLVAKKGATPTQAIHTAIEFCKEHRTSQCDLEYLDRKSTRLNSSHRL